MFIAAPIVCGVSVFGPCIVIQYFDDTDDFTTAGDWDRLAAVEHLPVLHYSVYFIFLSYGIMGFIVEL